MNYFPFGQQFKSEYENQEEYVLNFELLTFIWRLLNYLHVGWFYLSLLGELAKELEFY